MDLRRIAVKVLQTQRDVLDKINIELQSKIK
jgi:hypothetical protein